MATTAAKPQKIESKVPSAAPVAYRSDQFKSGRGLTYFQRIEIGIEDDYEFRVVKRLIGPKGKNVQDIVAANKGAKVWILGKGSCSWLDSVGPLTMCVGAMQHEVYESALTSVQELLEKVREDHRNFLRQHR